MESKVIIQKLLDEYEKYYLNYGQNKSRLIRSLVQPAETVEKHARHIATKETTYRMANYEFGSVIQPFSTTFNPLSEIEFFPNTINLEEMKVNVSITPHDIEQGYLGFLAGDETRTMKEWPIVRWLLEEYIAKQIQADRELKLVYNGKKVVGGTTPDSCMDGIKELLTKGATADYPVHVFDGIGPLNEISIFQQIEMFSKKIPELYTNRPVTIYVANKYVRAYKEAQRERGYYDRTHAGQIDTTIDFSGHKVVGLPSMQNTDDIWATVNNNLLWLTKREGNLAHASIQLHHYNVDILLDWWEALGFGCNQEVWTTKETVNATPADSGSGS
jgi:hypothetical protein